MNYFYKYKLNHLIKDFEKEVYRLFNVIENAIEKKNIYLIKERLRDLIGLIDDKRNIINYNKIKWDNRNDINKKYKSIKKRIIYLIKDLN